MIFAGSTHKKTPSIKFMMEGVLADFQWAKNGAIPRPFLFA